MSDPGAHEKKWRERATNEGFPLVEDKGRGLAEYDPDTANDQVELEKIKAFVDKILS